MGKLFNLYEAKTQLSALVDEAAAGSEIIIAKAGKPLTHTERLLDLPPHHADPFDRLLVAQALVEKATLVTHDRAIEPYGAPVTWT